MKPNNPSSPQEPTPVVPAPVSPEPAEPVLQMTPVAFSPTPNPDAMGAIAPQPRAEFQFPISVPIAIMLVTLIFSCIRDITALNKRMTIMNAENAPALEMLKQSGRQTEFIEALRDGVLKLAPTDPIAAGIARDFFQKPAPAKGTVPSNNASSSTPTAPPGAAPAK